jgi:multifunctional beta-oxidation protein
VLDKGKAVAVTTIVETKDVNTGELIFENQSTVFIRGAGGIGGKRVGKGVYLSQVSPSNSDSFVNV